MIAVVQKRNTNALASGLVPLLSKLSAGTEMASYAKVVRRKSLEGSSEISTFVAVQENSDDFMGCLLRVHMDMDASTPEQSDATDDTMDGSSDASRRYSATGFSMILVCPEAQGKGISKQLLYEAHPPKTSVHLVKLQTSSRYLCALYKYSSLE